MLIPIDKKCARCNEVKPSSSFGQRKNRYGKMVLNPRCAPCRVITETEYGKKYPERRKAKCKRTNDRIKRTVLTHYGLSCVCCGEQETRFLTIDHKEGDGAEHRRVSKCGSGTTFYAWLIRNKFPEGYQTLCLNCNLAKGKNGTCPHNDFDVMTMIGACA